MGHKGYPAPVSQILNGLLSPLSAAPGLQDDVGVSVTQSGTQWSEESPEGNFYAKPARKPEVNIERFFGIRPLNDATIKAEVIRQKAEGRRQKAERKDRKKSSKTEARSKEEWING